MERLYRSLRIVFTIDAWLSFSAPPLVLVGIPLMVVLEAPGWLLATTVLTLAGVLGGCGAWYAVVLSVGAARGRLELPDDALADLSVVGLSVPRPTVPVA